MSSREMMKTALTNRLKMSFQVEKTALINKVKEFIEMWRLEEIWELEEFDEPIIESDELLDKLCISLNKLPCYEYVKENKHMDRTRWIEMWLESGEPSTCSEETKQFMHNVALNTQLYVIGRDLKLMFRKINSLEIYSDEIEAEMEVHSKYTESEKETICQKMRDIKYYQMTRINGQFEEIINLSKN